MQQEILGPHVLSATGTDAEVSEPLVSVVIPTHKRPQLLQRALRSVIRQSYENLEIIVVDDGVSDEAEQVVAEFGDYRIRYLRHDRNRGGAAARNTGIRAATGKYIAFLDDDDEWEPEKIRAQLAALSRFDAVLCMYSMNGRPVKARTAELSVEADELRRGFVRGGSASALIARADVLRRVPFDETLPKCQDWDLCIRIVQKYSLACLPEALVRYNDGEHMRISNKLATLSAIDAESELKMLAKHKSFFGDKWYRRHMSKFLLYGISRRQDVMSHLLYVATRYGGHNVARVLLQRVCGRLARVAKNWLVVGKKCPRSRTNGK